MFGKLGMFFPAVSEDREVIEVLSWIELGEPITTVRQNWVVAILSRTCPELYVWLKTEQVKHDISPAVFREFVVWPLAAIFLVTDRLPDPEFASGFDLGERRKRLFSRDWTIPDGLLLALHSDKNWFGIRMSKLSSREQAQVGKMVIVMMTYLNWVFAGAAVEPAA